MVLESIHAVGGPPVRSNTTSLRQVDRPGGVSVVLLLWLRTSRFYAAVLAEHSDVRATLLRGASRPRRLVVHVQACSECRLQHMLYLPNVWWGFIE